MKFGIKTALTVAFPMALRCVLGGLLVSCLMVSVPQVTAQTKKKRIEPDIGYLYPAGGQQGTSVRILVGGQALANPKKLLVTGDGVKGVVVKFYKSFNNLNGDQRKEFKRQVKVRKATLAGKTVSDKDKKPLMLGEKPVKLPNHPLFENIDSMDERQLLRLTTYVQTFQKTRQLNAQLRDIVRIEVKIAKDAAPGPRELRLLTKNGLSTPITFEVGVIPETLESEPDDPRLTRGVPPEPALALPITVNGQILPGDVDRITFHARKGQNLVIEAKARALIPYLADAVPGWFQPVLTLYDPAGKEMAFADDFRFQPDPALAVHIPQNGDYRLEIRDSIYRGREDFIYRVSISGQPFVSHIFPLGAREGEKTPVKVEGWNLPSTTVHLDPTAANGKFHAVSWTGRGWHTNEALYAVDTLPETLEKEANDDPEEAQAITVPTVINGRLDAAKDTDVFRFDGKGGEKIVAEVIARRLNSPVDSVIHLLDEEGEVVGWNDDHMEKDGHLHQGDGLVTHHSDSYLQATLPRDGSYCLKIEDASKQGGPAFGYRMRVSPPRPDFRLRVTPSTINARIFQKVEVEVHVLRIDGYNGPITVELVDPPEGFKLIGDPIPPDQDRATLTLAMPRKVATGTLVLNFCGRGEVNGSELVRAATPADNQMQAFLWRHLVPAREMRVAVLGKWKPSKKSKQAKKPKTNPKTKPKPQLAKTTPGKPAGANTSTETKK